MKKTSSSKTQTPKPQDLPIVITATVMPLKDGKRRVLVSGAPDGEMPVVKAGLFADLHRLIDETWIALLKRKPQVVKKPKTADRENKPDTQEPAGAGEDETAPTDQLVGEPPEELPAIEGDEGHDADSDTDTRNGAQEDDRG